MSEMYHRKKQGSVKLLEKRTRLKKGKNNSKGFVILNIIILIMALGVFSVLASVKQLEANPEKLDNSVGINSLGPEDLKNVTTAVRSGIPGYIEITPISETPKIVSTNLNNFNITLKIQFISYRSNLTKTEVILDPKNNFGLKIEQSLGKDKGFFNINDCVQYSPSGKIVLNAGETKMIKMNIRIPSLPDLKGLSFPINTVGVVTDLPLIDNMEVTIND